MEGVKRNRWSDETEGGGWGEQSYQEKDECNNAKAGRTAINQRLLEEKKTDVPNKRRTND